MDCTYSTTPWCAWSYDSPRHCLIQPDTRYQRLVHFMGLWGIGTAKLQFVWKLPQNFYFGDFDFFKQFQCCIFFSIFTFIFGIVVFASSSPRYSAPETVQNTPKIPPLHSTRLINAFMNAFYTFISFNQMSIWKLSFLGWKFLVLGRGPDKLNCCEVAAEISLLTCSHLCSHISWYNVIGFLLPCGCSWITFWENSHFTRFTPRGKTLASGVEAKFNFLYQEFHWESSLLRWGWVFLERTRILSGI